LEPAQISFLNTDLAIHQRIVLQCLYRPTAVFRLVLTEQSHGTPFAVHNNKTIFLYSSTSFHTVNQPRKEVEFRGMS